MNAFQTREPEVKKKKKAARKHEDEKATKRQKTEGGLKLNTTLNVDILHIKVSCPISNVRRPDDLFSSRQKF